MLSSAAASPQRRRKEEFRCLTPPPENPTRALGLAAALSALALGCSAGVQDDGSAPPPSAPATATTPRPSRSFLQHFRTLNEDVRFVVEQNEAGGADKYVVRADGRREPQGWVMEEERVARLARYGALDPDLADGLDARPEHTLIPVAVYYREPAFPSGAEEAFRGEDDAVRATMLARVRELFASASTSIVERLADVGAIEINAGDTMPVVFARMTPSALRAAARFLDVTLILGDEGGPGEDYAASNAITTPKIDTVLNAPGFYGTGQKIGLIDNPQCALYDVHAALQFNTINYSVPPTTCAVDADCTSLCGGPFPMGSENLCRVTRDGSKHCVNQHASRVASVVSASKAGTRYGAANATLYVPTYGPGNRLHCSQDAMTHAYTWLNGLSVKTVNESWGCDNSLLMPAGSGDGVTQDYYARTYDMTIVKAAGDDPEQTAWGCRTSNALCVGGMNVSMSTVSVSPVTAYRNFPIALPADREKPDVVALSTGVEVMDVAGGPAATAARDGTSYGAPAMTALAALIKEACAPITLEHRYLRSLLMTSAWFYNAWEDPTFTVDAHRHYSTTDYNAGVDFQDGAGGPTADNARAFCGTTISGITTGGGATGIDLTGGTDGGSKPWMGASGAHGAPQPPGHPGGSFQGGPLKYYTLASFSLASGTRIRVTLAWDACPAGSTGTGPSGLPVDFDLFLCNDANQVCLSSRSFYNNWEGFDSADYAGGANLPFAGTWDVRVARDTSNSPGCGGSTTEIVGWSYAYGSPGSFIAHPN